jgi:hypothetical protein
MSLIEHAKREFLKAGYPPLDQAPEGMDKWTQENVLELLNAFAKQGHSGSSAPFIIDLFTKLANCKLLAPLTGELGEWNNTGHGFQNNRCTKVFKDTADGAAYTVEGYVFWHWSERGLFEDEEGPPEKTIKFKSYFTSNMSHKLVTFPYPQEEPEFVEVECFEVNKDDESIVEPGSARWRTIYPESVIQNKVEVDKALNPYLE